MKRIYPDSPVSFLPGVGATRQKQLAKLGVNTVKDLLYLFPRAYEKRGDVRLLSEASSDTLTSFILTVASEPKTANIRRGLSITKLRAFDDSGSCEVTFFNSPFVKDVFHIGSVFRFYGKITFSRKSVQLTNPKYEPVIPGIPLPSLVPVYPLTEGITSKFIDKITKTAIDETISFVKDPLPDSVRLKNSLPVLSYALKNIHFPESEDALRKSISRLAFDEMLLFGIGLSLNSKYKTIYKGIDFSPCDLKKLCALLPYELTGSQKNTINDIYRDTVLGGKNGSHSPMSRIVVGDVGSGKTVCAIAAMYIAASSDFQSALMAPTEILARQHYADIKKLFDKLNISTALLLGSTSQKEKNRIYEGLSSGEIKVVIGTHALLSDKVEFSSLGLIITDEQHRFGVAQRAVLKDRSKASHMLVMSATPIPRTLALTMYGDLDVSRITEMPKGRSPIDTFVVDESYRDRLNGFISKQIENGGQCYIVCPAIEKVTEDDSSYGIDSIKELSLSKIDYSNLKNTEEYTEKLRQSLPNLRIEALHGKMKSKEKDDIMHRFSQGEVDVLVSTTVIEVGVNVPNASLMIVENADRFGLAQLHQLRGRVGRGERKSYCVLVSDLNTEKAKARLNIMKSTNDGFEIAEKDLMLRGPGDFFATNDDSLRQSGGFEFKLAKLCDDYDLFEKAFSSAKEIVDSDPNLSLPENKALLETVRDYLIPTSSTIS